MDRFTGTSAVITGGRIGFVMAKLPAGGGARVAVTSRSRPPSIPHESAWMAAFLAFDGTYTTGAERAVEGGATQL